MNARPPLSSDDRLRIARGAERRFLDMRNIQLAQAFESLRRRREKALSQAIDSGQANAYAVQLAEFVRELEAAG